MCIPIAERRIQNYILLNIYKLLHVLQGIKGENNNNNFWFTAKLFQIYTRV